MTVGAFEAKTHLASLLARVAKGERVIITKHGTPVAMLIPVAPSRTEDRKELMKKIKQLRQGNRLGRINIRDLIEKGRRF